MSSASSSIVGYVNTVQGVLAKAIAEQRRELIERIERLAGPPSEELIEGVRAAVQARVVEEVTARLDRELRLMESVLTMKMRDATARIVDGLLEGRMAEMEDAIENKVNEVVDVKLALVRSPDVMKAAEPAAEDGPQEDAPERPADFTFVPKRRAGGGKKGGASNVVADPIKHETSHE